MQTARKAIRRFPGHFIKLAARMQGGEGQLGGRAGFAGWYAHWDTSAIIFDDHRTVITDGDIDACRLPGQRLVGGIVDHFLNDVGRAGRSCVHTRT